MSKLWAKVKFKQDKNAEYLIKAFFKDFSPENSIVIRGKEAKLEIVFREPPMTIIDAINHCEIIELNCGKDLKEYNPSDFEDDVDETTVSNFSEQPEQKNAEIISSEQPEQKNKKLELASIPELEKIAEKATSFDQFATDLAKWFEMGKRENFFTQLVIISAEVKKINWKELDTELKKRKIFYSQWDRVWAGRQVSAKLKAYSGTMLSFLKTVRLYKNFLYGKNEDLSTKSNDIIINNDEENIPRPRIKMDCMPEIKEFEEILASVDKTQSIIDRVRYVLNSMGLNKLAEEPQNYIVEIANTAVRKEKINLDTIFVDANINIPIEKTLEARMTFYDFINNFARKNGNAKDIKLLSFLSELQKIIMFENEIEKSSDFTD